jgi:hypothetical protein
MHAAQRLKVKFFNNDQERLNYEQDFGPEGNFDAKKPAPKLPPILSCTIPPANP